MKTNTLYILLNAVALPFLGLMYAIHFHSWDGFVFICSLGLFGGIFSWAAKRTLSLIKNKSSIEVDNTDPIAAIIFTSSLIGFMLLSFSVVESVYFHTQSKPLSFLVNDDYKDSLSVNEYRLLQMTCKEHYKTPMNIMMSDDKVYIRCGNWYPSVQVYETSINLFKKADEEASKIDPDSPIVITPKIK